MKTYKKLNYEKTGQPGYMINFVVRPIGKAYKLEKSYQKYLTK